MSDSVPGIVIHRLPLYLRALERMAGEGHLVTSSQELGRRLGISSAQIRKDLSHFGEFGKQGTGYEVDFLRDQLQRILKVDSRWDVVVIGAGDLGRALVNYAGFEMRNFDLRAIYDIDATKIGSRIGPLTVRDQKDLLHEVKRWHTRIAIIATPAESAQRVADLLIEGGVRAILCYAPIRLAHPESVKVEYIDPIVALQSMTYFLEAEGRTK